MSGPKRVYNLRRDPDDARDFKLRLIHPSHVLPKHVDNRHWFSPVRDQGDLGSCSSFSSAGGAFEMLEQKALLSKLALSQSAEVFGEAFKPVSTLFQYQNTLILENSFGKDAGATIRDAVKALATFGVCREEIWPYHLDNFTVRAPEEIYYEAAKHKISMYARIDSVDGIKQALAQGLPVVIGILVYESFESEAVAKSGIVPMPDMHKEQCLGGHAVCLAGYTEDGWIMRNSWGPGFGLGGYCILPHDYVNLKNGLAMDAWAITK